LHTFWLRGREIEDNDWLEPDGETEARIRAWIVTTEAALVSAIRARSDEMR
jgi:hypothetical protein